MRSHSGYVGILLGFSNHQPYVRYAFDKYKRATVLVTPPVTRGLSGRLVIAVFKSGKTALVYTSGTVLRTEVRDVDTLNFNSPAPKSNGTPPKVCTNKK